MWKLELKDKYTHKYIYDLMYICIYMYTHIYEREHDSKCGFVCEKSKDVGEGGKENNCE
jgi:hypothetical protein